MKVTIVERKFLRDNNSLHYTRLWSDLPIVQQQMLRSSIHLGADEQIILAFFLSENYWWVLTSKKATVYEKGAFRVVDLHKIERVELTEVFEAVTSKSNNKSIDLHSASDTIRLQLEQDSWPGMYNLFKFVTN